MDDASIARSLARWFDGAARDLPWRDAPAGRRNPYHVLVSELMLQQTQAARVAPRYRAFLRRFPTADALAAADLQDVLALWSGLGYYRRARHLHAAAVVIATARGGRFPGTLDGVLALPGVGRYTAGMIASLGLGLAEPAVDGNVRRVLLRLGGRDLAPREAEAWAWKRAAELVGAGGGHPGVTNEALIELGATICTPRAPTCERCPLAGGCAARAAGEPQRIPRPKARAARRPLYCAVALVADRSGRLLVERRGEAGLWSGLWQAPTLEADDAPPARAELAAHLRVSRLAPRGAFRFLTTHREMRFEVYVAQRERGRRLAVCGRRWAAPVEIAALPLASPQRRILLEPPIALHPPSFETPRPARARAG